MTVGSEPRSKKPVAAAGHDRRLVAPAEEEAKRFRLKKPDSHFLLQAPRNIGDAQSMEELSSEEIRRVVRDALSEDIGPGDATTIATIPENSRAEAVIRTREGITVAGIEFAEAAFTALAPDTRFERRFQDGQTAGDNNILLAIAGPASSLLSAERVALNFLQRLSGIATHTALFVNAIEGTRARILDTRKTTPLWRRMEKYAVECGGGRNHRIGLFDMILIKDNHLRALQEEPPNPIAAAVLRARKAYPALEIEVEADNLQQVRDAVDAGADIVLLDNMPLDQLRDAVQLVNGRAKTEASGGVSLGTVKAIAETGVDYISVGALTHSSRAVDIGLDFL